MIRLIFGVIIGAVIVVFAIQNTESVSFTFLAWTLVAPKALTVIAVFVFGILTGWLVTGLKNLGRRR